MELTIEQPCPSCGAGITLHEDDRLIRCEFCDVPNFRVQQKVPRYVLSPRLPHDVPEHEFMYVPYLRFKGCIYSIRGAEVRHTLIDTTRLGCDCVSLPVSLGLRPQAMRVTPVTEQLQGRFVRQSVKTDTIFAESVRLTELFSKDRGKQVRHLAFIGETVSRVYLPVYVHNDTLYDGITRQEFGAGSRAGQLADKVIPFSTDWEPRFISTICPQCGEAMQGDRESLVVNCANCEHQWLEENGRFAQLEYQVAPPREEGARFIPFWQIEPEGENPQLATLADFLELTNQPLVIRQQHRERKLRFIVPAFKMNPSLFLQIARNLTVLQTDYDCFEQRGFSSEEIYPVTLAHQEAVESLKSVLAAAAVSTKRVMELLPSLVFRASRKKLVYLPFRDTGHDCIEHHTGISLPTAALRYGRKL